MKPIVIFGAPRSGTTWLGQLFNSSPSCLYRFQPLFSYEFKNELGENSTPLQIKTFHEKLQYATSDFVLTSHKFSKIKPKHIVWKEVRYHNIANNLLHNSDIKIIYIQRDPVSTINSWYNAPKEFDKKNWNIYDEWLDAPSKNNNKPEEFNGYNKWREVRDIHNLNYKNFPSRVKIIDYNILRSDTINRLKDIFSFCDIEWNKQTEDFINFTKTSHNNDHYSVFKNKTSIMTLPELIINQIKQKSNELYK